jgi:hypothetical protein
MNIGSINWLAVLACVIVSMVVGSVWFHPKTFFTMWWKAIGKSENDGPGASSLPMGLVWGLIILCSFIQAVFMALFVNAMGSMSGGATLGSGLLAGFLLWLGFVAPTSLTNKLFADRLKAWVLEAGNHLVVFLLFGAILGAWH